MLFIKPICFFDLETTGSDTAKDRIVSIAVRKYISHTEFIDKQTLVNPEMPIPAGATEVHGITDEMVTAPGIPKFKQIARNVVEFFDGCDLGGYNITTFDIPLLAEEFIRAGIFDFPHDTARIFDSCAVFKKKEERTLTAAVKFYLGEEMEGAHNAMNDVVASARVLFAQLQHYEDLGDMDESELATFMQFDNRLDLAGKFIINDEGDVILNFGKHKGEEALKQPGFLDWMLRQDFISEQTKMVTRNLLKR